MKALAHRLAAVVVANLVKRKGLERLAEDTPWLDFIIDLIQQLLPILIGCFSTPALAGFELRKPGVLTRVRLRLAIRQKLDDRESIDLLAGPMFDAMLDAGKTVTDAEVAAAIAA